jgi:hypothetical protein
MAKGRTGFISSSADVIVFKGETPPFMGLTNIVGIGQLILTNQRLVLIKRASLAEWTDWSKSIDDLEEGLNKRGGLVIPLTEISEVKTVKGLLGSRHLVIKQRTESYAIQCMGRRTGVSFIDSEKWEEAIHLAKAKD